MKSINLFYIRHIACFVFVLAFLMPAKLCANDKSPLCFTARNGSVTVSFGIMSYVHHFLFDSTITKVGEYVTITDSIQHHHSIQYSTDSIHWMHYESRQEVTIDDNQSIYFRAERNQVYAYSFTDIGYDYPYSTICSQFSFASSNGGTVEGSGNIMSLYGPDCPDLPLMFLSFYKMFEGCKLLAQAPSLPATSLSFGCYFEMFKDCISLASAPSLPATKLNANCYNGMFKGCISLTKAPTLPAATMFFGCYEEMFEGCTSLTKAPRLPATKLDRYCYRRMFKGCTSLVINTTGPGKKWIIRAKTEDDDAMEDMFQGTGGTMNGTPETKTTYYIFSDTKGKRNH